MELTNIDAGRIGTKLLLLLLAVGMVLPAVAGGAAVATETATTEAGDAVTLPANETVEITNQTTDVWVEVGNASGTVNATVWGIDADGNETEVGTVTLNATDGDTAMQQVAINSSAYESARVELSDDSSDNTTATVETFDAGVISKLGGGGTGGSDTLDWGLGSVQMSTLLGGGVAVVLLLLSAVAVYEG